MVRAYTPEQAAAKVAEIEAKLAALEDRRELKDIPASIDWDGWSTENINKVLGAYFFYIQLGPDLLPVRSERRLPPEYWT